MAETHRQTPEDLAWAIESRRRSQRILLRVRTYKELPKDMDPSVLHDMVGVAFSLWRASFLAHARREDGGVRKAAEAVLWKLLEDNSFGFGDEKTCCDWMVGYYVNNARFRVERILEKIGRLAPNPLVSDLEGRNEIKAFRGMPRGLPEKSPLREEWTPHKFWDTLYGAANEIARAIGLPDP